MIRIDLKKAILLLLLSLIPVKGLYSQDLGTAGYTILSEKKVNGEILYEVTDAQGNTFTIQTPKKLTQPQIDLLSRLQKSLYTWENMKIDTLRMIIADMEVEINVVPELYEYEGMDLTYYLPSGMQFYYDKFLEYDFRTKINTLFLRVRGRYVGEKELSEKLASAIRDPSAYIQAYDQEFMVRKFLEIDVEAESFQKILQTLQEDTKSLREYYNSLREEGSLAYDLLKEELDNLEEVDSMLKEAHDTLKKEHQLSDEQQMLLSDRFALLRYALIAMQNRGFFDIMFGGPDRPIDKNAIERLVALKKENPALTKKEASDLLKQEGINMTIREVSIIFSVYFNEFE